VSLQTPPPLPAIQTPHPPIPSPPLNHPHTPTRRNPQDFGARDPFAAEIESNFGEKVLGNYNTDHIIKPPEAMGKILGLAAREMPPVAELAVLDDSTRERLRQQVPGWRVVNAGAAQAIQQEWAAKDGDSARRLAEAIGGLGAAAGHAVAAVETVGASTVVARLTTQALGECAVLLHAFWLFAVDAVGLRLDGWLVVGWLGLRGDAEVCAVNDLPFFLLANP